MSLTTIFDLKMINFLQFSLINKQFFSIFALFLIQEAELIDDNGKSIKKDDTIQFTKTQRGRAMLLHQGFKYVKNRESTSNIFWRCARYVKHGCRATLVTSRNTPKPSVRLSGMKHSHDREMKNSEKLE